MIRSPQQIHGATQPRLKWVPDLFPGDKTAGACVGPHFILQPRLKNE